MVDLNINFDLALRQAARTRLTRQNLEKWISDSNFDEYTSNALLQTMNKYPGNTIIHFYNNLQHHLNTIREQRPK